jgi:hypothetical protein
MNVRFAMASNKRIVISISECPSHRRFYCKLVKVPDRTTVAKTSSSPAFCVQYALASGVATNEYAAGNRFDVEATVITRAAEVTRIYQLSAFGLIFATSHPVSLRGAIETRPLLAEDHLTSSGE